MIKISVVVFFISYISFIKYGKKEKIDMRWGDSICWRQEEITNTLSNGYPVPVYGCKDEEVPVLFVVYYCEKVSSADCYLYPGDLMIKKHYPLFFDVYNFSIYGIFLLKKLNVNKERDTTMNKAFAIGLTPDLPVMTACLKPGKYMLLVFGKGLGYKGYDSLFVSSDLTAGKGFLVKHICGSLEKIKTSY